MPAPTRITIVIVIVIVLVAAGAYWYLARDDDRDREPAPPMTSTPPLATPPAAEQRPQVSFDGVALDGSDSVVRDVVARLSQRPELVVWLGNEDLVRRFVAAVNNIAEGVNPRAHLEFLKPRGPFKVQRMGDRIVVDPESWQRYDAVTAVLVSIDTEGAVRLLAEMEPLIEAAHREIAPPGASFRASLVKAVDHLLAAPEIDGSEALEAKVVTYAYRDDSLESLPGVERQLLRMGPENVAKIKAKLGDLRRALAP